MVMVYLPTSTIKHDHKIVGVYYTLDLPRIPQDAGAWQISEGLYRASRSPENVYIYIFMGILGSPPKATPPNKSGLIKGLLTIGFP